MTPRQELEEAWDRARERRYVAALQVSRAADQSQRAHFNRALARANMAATAAWQTIQMYFPTHPRAG